MRPDLFGGLWVIITLFIWQWLRWITTFSPRTWYQAKHRSQPFGSKLHGQDKSLAWCESLPVHLVYLCHPTKCGTVTFLVSLGGVYTAASFIQRRESQIWLTVGAVMESRLFLKLQSLVVLGGKWLPFSLVGGIPTFVKEPHWWCINGFPCSMIRRQHLQIK